MHHVVESDGIEVYRIRSNVDLRWAPELELTFEPRHVMFWNRMLEQAISDLYLLTAVEMARRYDWIEGYSAVGEDLQIRTDYPVLDVRNRTVPDLEAAGKRLSDLKEIEKEVNRRFRQAKRDIRDPAFARKLHEQLMRAVRR